MTNFPRISQDVAVMDGKPCIRGMQVTVRMIGVRSAPGLSVDVLIAYFPYLQREDILEALVTRHGRQKNERSI